MNDSNLLNGSNYCTYEQMESPIEKTLKLMTCLVLGGVGISGNVFVIVLAVKYTVTKNLHFLIINMAVADILFIMFHLQRHVNDSFLQNYIWNNMDETIANVLCKTFSFLVSLFFTESLITLLIISIERYRVTRKIVQISRPLSTKHRVAIIACCWFIAMVMNVLLFLSVHVKRRNSEKDCVNYSNNKEVSKISFFAILATVLVFYLSMAVLSILTLRSLSKPQAIEDSLSEVQRQHRRKRIRNAVKMVLYSLLLYSCSWGPFYVVAVYLYFSGIMFIGCVEWSMLFFFAWYVLPLVNSCLSPVIYCVCLSDFREAARRVLCFAKTPSSPGRNSVVPRTRRIENSA